MGGGREEEMGGTGRSRGRKGTEEGKRRGEGEKRKGGGEGYRYIKLFLLSCNQSSVLRWREIKPV